MSSPSASASSSSSSPPSPSSVPAVPASWNPWADTLPNDANFTATKLACPARTFTHPMQAVDVWAQDVAAATAPLVERKQDLGERSWAGVASDSTPAKISEVKTVTEKVVEEVKPGATPAVASAPASTPSVPVGPWRRGGGAWQPRQTQRQAELVPAPSAAIGAKFLSGSWRSGNGMRP